MINFRQMIVSTAEAGYISEVSNIEKNALRGSEGAFIP
jgi:hypothetical protein